MTDQLTDARGYRCSDPSCVTNTGGAWDGYCGSCEQHYADLNAEPEEDEEDEDAD